MATVLVDLDGTLIPLDAWEPVFLEVCERIARQVGATAEEVWKRARRRNLELMRAFAVEAFDWQSLFRSVAEELGAREVPDLVEVLYKHIHTFRVNRGHLRRCAGLGRLATGSKLLPTALLFIKWWLLNTSA